MTTTTSESQLDWLLQQFVEDVVGVHAVVVTSQDGIRMAHFNLDNATTGAADTISALSSGVYSLAKGASRALDTNGVSQILLQMGDSVVVIMAAGEGAVLSVMGTPDADGGQLIHETALLVRRMPQRLTVPERNVLDSAGQAHF